ncbi:MAG: hypothetical protein KAR06_08095 [Deltaproteobacteria bacterium]|nr:hypothetical protein [Deltaproteobacteria bacterium]
MQKMEIIIHAIPNLDTSDLREILSRVNYVLKQREGVVLNSTEDLFYTAFSNILTRVLGKRLPQTLGGFRKSSSHLKKFKTVHQSVDSYIENLTTAGNKKITINRIERLAFYRRAFRLVVDHIDTHMKIPMSMSVVLNTMDNLPGIMDLSYPGYAKAGMGYLILKPTEGLKHF